MIALTGATGFVGGALREQLVRDGYAVRSLSRKPGPDAVQADVLDRNSLDAALEGVDAAYYLVHALGDADGFDETEARGARNFAVAAGAAGVGRIVYLGGLAHGDDLSPHMRSRREVGRILAEGAADVVELRASIVVGAGSLSYELLRELVDALPLMALPSWVDERCQPIAIDDLVQYLVQSLDVPAGVYEIGGADVLTYRELLSAYADEAGLATVHVQLPGLRVPVPDQVARLLPERARAALKLIESLGVDSTVQEPSGGVFTVDPRGVRAAIRAAA